MPKVDFCYIVGRQFGRITVRRVISPNQVGNKRTLLECLCSCGTLKTILAKSILSGRCESCGCLQKERLLRANVRHGKCRTPEYRIWKGIKQRCNDPNHIAFARYGASGIKVCERWLGRDGFINFLCDMGNRPSAKHTVDRYPDQNGDYSPENCRWADYSEQAVNRKTSIVVTIGTTTKPLAAFAKESGLSIRMARSRYKRGIRGSDLLLLSGALTPRDDRRDNRGRFRTDKPS